MLDQILGKAELKESVARLEEERERLSRQLDAESDRRREAVRDRQDAEERINHLEDRVAGLEGELDRVREDESEPTFFDVRTLSRQQVPEILHRLESFETGPEGALTAAVEDSPSEGLREVFDADMPLVTTAAPCIVCVDDMGVIRVALAPPRHPGTFETWESSFTFEREWFVPIEPFTFALARADRFAVGRFESGELHDIDAFESEVMSRHSKGGFSQDRFERRRDAQIDEHLERCEESLDARSADLPLILVGDRRIIGRLNVEPTTTGTVDASGSPREAIRHAFEDFWRTRVYLF